MKNKSSKLARIENKRFSIFTNKMNTCYICGGFKNDLHELIGGSRRIVSMKEGLVIPVCRICHFNIENSEELKEMLKKEAEKKWLEVNEATIEEFIEIFGKNYL